VACFIEIHPLNRVTRNAVKGQTDRQTADGRHERAAGQHFRQDIAYVSDSLTEAKFN